jgi:hypothetical protein
VLDPSSVSNCRETGFRDGRCPPAPAVKSPRWMSSPARRGLGRGSLTRHIIREYLPNSGYSRHPNLLIGAGGQVIKARPIGLQEPELVPAPLGSWALAPFGIRSADPAGEIGDAANRERIEAGSRLTGSGKCFPRSMCRRTLVSVSDGDCALPRKPLAGAADRRLEGA